MFIFDSMSAVVLAIIITFVAILAVAVTAQIENTVGLKRKATMLSEKVAEVVGLAIDCVFTVEQLDHYREKMISHQPIDNDRILPGSGKDHTLKAIDTVANGQTPIPSVVEQVGDVF